MSVIRTRKQSDLEKKLSVLNRQLYGKNEDPKGNRVSVDHIIKDSVKIDSTLNHNEVKPLTSDVAFLKKDLGKIALLSGIAFAIELGLYFSQIYTKLKLF